MISNGQILAEISALKTTLQRMVDVQSSLIIGLRQDNRDMLNRFMSHFNMPMYAQTSPANVAEMNFPAEKLAREDDFGKEFLAGEIADNET
jgi:hypothetical protein